MAYPKLSESAALIFAAIAAPDRFANRAAFLVATIPAVVMRSGYLTAFGVVSFVRDATGTAATTADLGNWSPDGEPSSLHWGAGVGTTTATNDSAALTAAFAWTVARNQTLLLQGIIWVHETVVVVGAPLFMMRAGDDKSQIRQVLNDRPTFEFQLNGADFNYFHVKNIKANVIGGATIDPLCVFIRLTGDINRISNGVVADNNISHYYSFLKVEKLPRTTAFGDEGGLNWTIFSHNHLTNLFYAYWFTQGTGTGNGFDGDKPQIRDTGSYIGVDGVAGVVAGDVLISGTHGRSVSGSAALFTAGAGLAYRNAITITGNQFDAGMDKVFVVPTTEDWYSVTIADNAYNANVDIGTDLGFLRSPVVADRYVSDWKAGMILSDDTIGAVTMDLFDIDLSTVSAQQSVRAEIDVSGNVGGVGRRVSSAVFFIETDGATMAINEVSQDRSNSTNRITISVASISATKARISATFTSTGTGSSSYSTVRATGGPAFKITRLI